MAWTSKADRFSAKDLKVVDTPDTLGPGAYGTHERPRAQPIPAPFNSTKIRGQDLDTKAQEVGPPPGAYDPQLPRSYDAGLPRKKVPFATGASRLPAAPKEMAPGPGRYHEERALEVLPCRTMGVPEPLEGGKKYMMKSASAPSIPRGHQCWGYEEKDNGKLVRQGPKDGRHYFTGEPNDAAGPGHYESHQIFTNAPRGGKFMQGPARTQLAAPEAPGPGHYVGYQPEQGKSVCSAFVSTSSQRPVHKKPTKKNSTPGPGSYAQTSMSAPSLREQHPELQYFGSTSERFKEQRPVTECPGPGTYVAQQRVVLKSNWSVGQRFRDSSGAATMPGPGAYTHADAIGAPNTSSLLGSTGASAFGSTEARRGIASKLAATAPGPGAYDLSAQEAELEPERPRQRAVPPRPAVVRQQQQNQPDASWQQPARGNTAGPAPGAYDPVHARDTARVMHLDPKGGGFGSGGARSTAPGIQGVAPGPGNYNPAAVTGGKRVGTFNRVVVEGGVMQSGRPKGLGFESQSRRFTKDSEAGKMPGPGTYKTDPNWTKKNFNVHFGDI